MASIVKSRGVIKFETFHVLFFQSLSWHTAQRPLRSGFITSMARSGKVGKNHKPIMKLLNPRSLRTLSGMPFSTSGWTYEQATKLNYMIFPQIHTHLLLHKCCSQSTKEKQVGIGSIGLSLRMTGAVSSFSGNPKTHMADMLFTWLDYLSPAGYRLQFKAQKFGRLNLATLAIFSTWAYTQLSNPGTLCFRLLNPKMNAVIAMPKYKLVWAGAHLSLFGQRDREVLWACRTLDWSLWQRTVNERERRAGQSLGLKMSVVT